MNIHLHPKLDEFSNKILYYGLFVNRFLHHIPYSPWCPGLWCPVYFYVQQTHRVKSRWERPGEFRLPEMTKNLLVFVWKLNESTSMEVLNKIPIRSIFHTLLRENKYILHRWKRFCSQNSSLTFRLLHPDFWSDEWI